MIEDIVGITFWTDDLPAMFHFYNDILRLPVHSKHDAFIAFQVGELRLNLGNHPEVNEGSKDPYRIMANFSVRDILSTYRDLVNQGVQFIREPEKESWGGVVATFLDPDGNILQLLEFPNP